MNKKTYIDEVLKEVSIPKEMKKRVKEDLIQRIDQGFEEDPFFNILDALGHPKEFADDITDTYYQEYGQEGKPNIVSSAIKSGAYEYKSKKNLFGLPLIHINTGGKYGIKHAKGIFAIGDLASGVVSLGGISLGLFSFGGISLGGIAIGGVAIGGLAIGGLTLGLYAIGGAAFAVFEAFGGFTKIL